ncbi:hypothetical protein ACWEP4_38200 [Streptomyces sp. NPDC004227]
MLTTVQSEAELAQATGTDLSDLALPDLIPRAALPAEWRTPPFPATRTAPSRPAPIPSDPARHSDLHEGPGQRRLGLLLCRALGGVLCF